MTRRNRRHLPGRIWTFWREPRSGSVIRQGYLRTTEDGEIEVVLSTEALAAEGRAWCVRIDRRAAIMLHRRLGAVLEATR